MTFSLHSLNNVVNTYSYSLWVFGTFWASYDVLYGESPFYFAKCSKHISHIFKSKISHIICFLYE